MDELRVSNCHMVPQVTLELLEVLAEVDIHLRKLSLVNAAVNSESVPLLCELITKSKHLVELDISYNGLNYADMAQIIAVLA